MVRREGYEENFVMPFSRAVAAVFIVKKLGRGVRIKPFCEQQKVMQKTMTPSQNGDEGVPTIAAGRNCQGGLRPLEE